MTQLGLNLSPAPSPKAARAPRKARTVDERFAAWLATDEGAAAYRVIERDVLDAVARGAGWISIDEVFTRMRHVPSLRKANGEQYALNNSYRAPIARRLIAAHPALAGVIECRRRKGEGR